MPFLTSDRYIPKKAPGDYPVEPVKEKRGFHSVEPVKKKRGFHSVEPVKKKRGFLDGKLQPLTIPDNNPVSSDVTAPYTPQLAEKGNIVGLRNALLSPEGISPEDFGIKKEDVYNVPVPKALSDVLKPGEIIPVSPDRKYHIETPNMNTTTVERLVNTPENVNPVSDTITKNAVKPPTIIKQKVAATPYDPFNNTLTGKLLNTVNPTVNLGITSMKLSDIAALATMVYGGIATLKSLPFEASYFKYSTTKTILDRGLDNYIATQGRLPPEARNPVMNWILKNRSSFIERATNNFLDRIGRTSNVAQAVDEATTATTADIQKALTRFTETNTGIPGQTMSMADILSASTAQLKPKPIVPQTIQPSTSVQTGLPGVGPKTAQMKAFEEVSGKGSSKQTLIGELVPNVPEIVKGLNEVTAPIADTAVGKAIPAAGANLVEAIWRTKAGDQPIKITGLTGEMNGVKYYNIEGSKAAIPETEITRLVTQPVAQTIQPSTSVQVGDTITDGLVNGKVIGTGQYTFGKTKMDGYKIEIASGREKGKQSFISKDDAKLVQSSSQPPVETAPQAPESISTGITPPAGQVAPEAPVQPPVKTTQPAPTAPVPPTGQPPVQTVKPVARRNEINELLKMPGKALPKGVTKVALKYELGRLNEKIKPLENSLRQNIMATIKSKGITTTQARKIFRETGGDSYLTNLQHDELQKVLARVQTVRPEKLNGKTVITQTTEKSIQSLKDELIGNGKLNDLAYDNIMRYLKLDIDRYVSSSLFLTESEGKILIKQMNFEAEVGLIERDARVAEGIIKHPEIGTAIESIKGKINKLNQLYINGEKASDASRLWDMWLYTEKLQDRSGQRFYDVMRPLIDRSLTNESKTNDLMMTIKTSTPKFNKIATDKKAIQRVNDYIASKNKLGPEPPKDITPDEIKLAEKIDDVLKSFWPKVREERFISSYTKHDGDVTLISKDIPNAPIEDVKQAVKIYESKGLDNLKQFLNTKDWGVIKSGYEPHIVVSSRVSTGRFKKTVMSKGMLKTREGIDFSPEEKDIIQRTQGYIHRMYNLDLEPYINKLDQMVKDANLVDPSKVAGTLSRAGDELAGTFYISEPLWRAVNKLTGYAYTAVYLAPHLAIRNLLQILALHPDRGNLFNPLNHSLTDQEMKYMKIFTNQENNFKNDYLLQQELGIGRLSRIAKNLTYMGKSEYINNLSSFWMSLNKADRALKVYQKDGDIQKFIKDSGMQDLTPRQKLEALELLAQDKVTIDQLGTLTGQEVAIDFIARRITHNVNLIYDRGQRSAYEMGSAGRIAGSLATFPRGVGQRILNYINQVKSGDAKAKSYAFQKLVGIIVFGILAGEIYKKVSGKGGFQFTGKPGADIPAMLRNNPYNPINMITWGFGGLSLSSVTDLSTFVNDFINAFTSRDPNAIKNLTPDANKVFDEFAPFYKEIMNAIEAFTNTKYLDREAMRKILNALGMANAPDTEYYKQNRDLIAKLQHVFFSSEPSSTVDPIQTAVKTVSDSIKKLGIVDTIAKDNALKTAKTANDKARVNQSDWTYTIADLGSDIDNATYGLEPAELVKDNGFPDIVNYYWEYKNLSNAYYDELEANRAAFKVAYPEFETMMIFWGKWNPYDTITQDKVRQLANQYGIPENAIPALKLEITTKPIVKSKTIQDFLNKPSGTNYSKKKTIQDFLK